MRHLEDYWTKDKGQKKAIELIILFHLIGLIGLLVPATHLLFLKLVHFHLLLMLMVVIYSHNSLDRRFLLFALLLFLLGFGVEWLGAVKHLLFGDYTYGKTLGVALFDVPLIIGVNWFLLIYSTGVLMQQSRVKNKLIRIFGGALLLVLLDLLIEPVAVKLDYWRWANNTVPISNYVCWFIVSGFMLLLFEQFGSKKQNCVAPVLLLTQFIFFGILYIVQTVFLP